MRFATDGKVWDRLLPAFVLPYAIWTLYVHLIVSAHASFTTLLQGLPLVAVVAVAATAGWFRLHDPAAAREPTPAVQGSAAPATPGPTGMGNTRAVPLAVLAAAMLWVGLLSAGMPYAVFWWGGLLAMCGAWIRHLRGRHSRPQAGSAVKCPAWLVPCVIAAAVCVVLVANRPDADDALYLSIPATLLRLPQQPVLLHDTMYRLPEGSILLPFYRLSNYNVLIGAVARLTGIDHLLVAYLVLPALFAAIVVFAWIYLLRRIVPARWPVVLPILFLCVMAFGEAHRAYGNFAFVRLFQGKAILAACMVPAIAGAALAYARHGGLRHWLLLCAAQIAALGVAASALFVAPATAALGLAGGWSPDARRSLRFVLGLLPAAYLFGAAWLVGSDTREAQALALPSAVAMPSVPHLLERTWGVWSTRVLLTALLAAWAFVRDPVRARYFSAGAFFFLLVALNPYTTPFVAAHSVGAKTYWRLTWALPLPLFLAVIIDGMGARALALRPKALAVGACLALSLPAIVFGSRFGTLLRANHVTLGFPGPKVPPIEFGVAREVAEHVDEKGTVLAPQDVATWLPAFAVRPNVIGVRHMYLSLAFTPRETAQRSNMMRYVEGKYRPADAERWFAESVRRYRLTAVVFSRSAPWAKEIETILGEQGWRPLSCGAYEIQVRGEPGIAAAGPAGCGTQAIPARP
ncbi:hypothetical protein GCM10027084_26960 [Pseudoxanthomonas sangjuensis]|uniref:DUF6077 domain-containing protein n=1 Tax=Pseudoxanthomonas sangjuensis TaxID=1503750 RepID=UPI00139073DF|nr:DUF6077 domain-containing protein [Pseudoxanthomonas sangjuensis]KAF1714514.1 hypothetical protein CSC71_03875 [Pseudoxanthomonas sangjuensis]